MKEAKQLLIDVKKGNIKPIYFLMGEEAFFIDMVSGYIEKNILSEEERGFNQVILYGKDVSIQDIIANAKRYPMMAERQVVIVKEAQHLKRYIEELASYAEQPQPTTVLVICFKYDKIDKRKGLYKALNKTGVVLESKKLYDNQVENWITQQLHNKGYQIEPKASFLLVEFLGLDLSRIHNELEKLRLVISQNEVITPALIEQHIGISKDYNNFELKKAIGERDILKATRIITYFAQNPKDNPFVLTVSLLYKFFTQLLQYHGLADKSSRNISSVLRVSPYFVKEYQIAAKNYPMRKVSQVVSELRILDLKGKGVGARDLNDIDLLKELLVKII